MESIRLSDVFIKYSYLLVHTVGYYALCRRPLAVLWRLVREKHDWAYIKANTRQIGQYYNKIDAVIHTHI